MLLSAKDEMKKISYSELMDYCNHLIRHNQTLNLKLPVLISLFSILTDNVSIIERSFNEIVSQIEWQDTANKFLSLFGLEYIVEDATNSLIKACEMFAFRLDHLNAFSYCLNLANEPNVFFAESPSISKYYEAQEKELSSNFDDYFFGSLIVHDPSTNKCFKYLITEYSKSHSDHWMTEVTDSKETWLHMLATTGRYDIFQLFLPHYQKKYEIANSKETEKLLRNLKTHDGQTILHKAATLSLSYGNQDSESQAVFIKNLIHDFPCLDINDPDSNGNTPLNLFIYSGINASAELETESLDILFALGANPNIASNSGKAPLHHIVEKEHYYDKNARISKYLITKRADVLKKDIFGNSPISIVNSKLQESRYPEEKEHWKDFLSFIQRNMHEN